jgi:hypothetical protein
MKYLIPFLLLICLYSKGQYIKIATIAAGAGIKSFYVSQVVGQSSVANGISGNFSQGFKQPVGSISKNNLLSYSNEPSGISFDIFPNPFSSELTLQFNNYQPGLTNLQLFNVNGNLIWAGQIHELPRDLKLPFAKDLPSGKYLFQIEKAGYVQSKAIIKAF